MYQLWRIVQQFLDVSPGVTVWGAWLTFLVGRRQFGNGFIFGSVLGSGQPENCAEQLFNTNSPPGQSI